MPFPKRTGAGMRKEYSKAQGVESRQKKGAPHESCAGMS